MDSIFLQTFEAYMVIVYGTGETYRIVYSIGSWYVFQMTSISCIYTSS